MADTPEISNVCDWCGDVVEEEELYSAVLSCARRTCGRHMYHQACIEDHLRKHKMAPARLSGFPCPYGHGRKSPSEPCNGKIESTHKKIAKNKVKKAQAAQVFVPPPKPPPGPKAKVAAAAQVQQPSARPVVQNLNKPTPVRGNVRGNVPPGRNLAVAPPEKSKAEMRAMIASYRNDIACGRGLQTNEHKAALQAAAPTSRFEVKTILPGEGLSARMGKGKQQAYIPGMEPADPRPPPAACPHHPAGTAAKPFNLLEQNAAFPSLGVAKLDEGQSSTSHWQENASQNDAINALDPNHQSRFVSDLARFNALLGLDINDDGFDEYNRAQPSPLDNDLSAGDALTYQQAYEAEKAADLAEMDPTSFTDQVLLSAYLNGDEQVPAAFVPLIQQMYSEFGDPREWNDMPAMTPDERADADLAEYLAAEQVVIEAERNAVMQAQAEGLQYLSDVGNGAPPLEAWNAEPTPAQAVQLQQPHAALDIWSVAPNAQLPSPKNPGAFQTAVSLPRPRPVAPPPSIWSPEYDTHAPQQAVLSPNDAVHVDSWTIHDMAADLPVPVKPEPEVDEELLDDLMSLCLA